MEQEIIDRSLMKQRAGIVQKQVAAGREFKVSAVWNTMYVYCAANSTGATSGLLAMFVL